MYLLTPTRTLVIACLLNLFLFGMVVFGFVPRMVVPFWFLLMLIYVIGVSIREALLFFIFSIPIFVATPITNSYDSLNMWRIVAIVLFFKWFGMDSSQALRKLWILFSGAMRPSFKNDGFLFFLLLLISSLSLFVADSFVIGLKRMIFFINLSVPALIVYFQARVEKNFFRSAMVAIVASLVVIILFGGFQLVTVYLNDVYGFMKFWGEGVQCLQFGNSWCNIAVWIGNTWLAYNGPDLILRMFSSFPDSHSFPLYIVFSLPALFCLKSYSPKWSVYFAWLLILVSLLFMILSGTRGIWAGWLAALFTFLLLRNLLIKRGIIYLNIIRQIAITLIAFLLLFGIALPIFSSPQFKVSGDSDRLSNRLKSVLDFGETSNAARIKIWEKTSRSVLNNPFLGVGIGNFPVVLGEDLRLAKAGSSAHNLYLHVAAEVGILGGFVFVLILFRHLKRLLIIANQSSIRELREFALVALVFNIWGFAYLLTDVVLFDERVFLLFSVVFAIVLATAPNRLRNAKQA